MAQAVMSIGDDQLDALQTALDQALCRSYAARRSLSIVSVER
jgi:hypothetical protein